MKSFGLWILNFFDKPQADRLASLERKVAILQQSVEEMEQSMTAIRELLRKLEKHDE